MTKYLIILLSIFTSLSSFAWVTEEDMDGDFYPIAKQLEFANRASDPPIVIRSFIDLAPKKRIKPARKIIHVPKITKEKLKIMVIDTGVSNHLFLIPWLKYSPKDDDTSKDSYHVGHGTHVAGIIAYGPMNNMSTVRSNELCSDVEIIPCKAFIDKKQSKVDPLFSCLDKAIKMKVDVINYSGGGDQPLPHELRAWRKFVKTGGLIVMAAGNNGSDLTKSKFYPASWGVKDKKGKIALKHAYVVSSLDDDGFVSRSSDYAPDAIYEKGSMIISTYPNNKFETLSGTSMAAPVFTHKIAKSFCQTKLARQSKKTITKVANK